MLLRGCSCTMYNVRVALAFAGTHTHIQYQIISREYFPITFLSPMYTHIKCLLLYTFSINVCSSVTVVLICMQFLL